MPKGRSMHQLRFFGTATLHGPAGPLTGPATHRHPLALLAFLATAPSRTVSRGRLIGLLWPDASEPKARNRLTSCLYHVRQALGEGVVVSSADNLRLTGSTLECDVWQFEDALERGDSAAAVRHYGGPLLEGFHLHGAAEFDHWVDRERDRLHRRWLQALEDLAEAEEAAGRPGRAVRWWKERAAADPYHGRVVQRLMGAMEAAGNPAGALEVADAHTALLREELGVDPAEGVVELRRDIRERCTKVDSTASSRSRRRPSASTATDPPTRDLVSLDAAVENRRLHGRWHRHVFGIALGLIFIAITGAALVGWRMWGGGFLDAEGFLAPRQAMARELALQADSLDGEVLGHSGGTQRRVALYERALELDPTAASIWAALADAYVDLSWGRDRSYAWADSALATARKAIDLEPGSADGYVQLADAFWARGSHEDQAAAYRRALELDPTHREGFNNLAALLYFRGSWAEAIQLHQEALERSTDAQAHAASLVWYGSMLGRDSVVGAWLIDGRRFGHDLDGVELEINLFHRQQLDRARELLPQVRDAHPLTSIRRRAALALYEERWDEARRLYRQLYPGEPTGHHLYKGLLWDPLGLAHALSRGGDPAEARAIAQEVIDDASHAAGATHGTYIVPNRLAVAHLLRGDTAAALQWLERAVDRGFLDLRRMRTVPTLTALRDHPDFHRLAFRMESRLAELREAADPILTVER